MKNFSLLLLFMLIAGGLDRCGMIVTNAGGSQPEAGLNNLFSMACFNFGSIKENQHKVLRTIRQYTNEGWKTEHIIPLSLSSCGNSTGIFMAHYVLSRDEKLKQPFKRCCLILKSLT